MTNGSRSVMDLLAEVTKMMDMPLDSNAVSTLQQQIRVHPLHRAMQSVLIDQKAKVDLSMKMIKNETEEANEGRLDNMLKAEGVTGPVVLPAHVNSETDHNEYHQHLVKVRKQFQGDIELCEKNRSNWCENVKKVLQSHREFRPISHGAIEKMSLIMSNKFNRVSVLLKQGTCEQVIQLKKRFFDARRKRRNFSKSSTEILNDYFQANINHPYPPDDVKHALALQCNISVAQVSNWFGNKRIRYKKSMANANQNERKAQRPIAHTPAMPNPFGGVPMNPYQMMMPGPQFPMGMPFNIPMYTPEMMAQWQQQQLQEQQDKGSSSENTVPS